MPDRAAGTSNGGAAGFNILTPASGFQNFFSGLKDAVSNALGGVQGRGNFEKGRQGDNTAANQEAKAIADQAGLSQGQREIFHREISKQGYNKAQLLEEAQRIKSTYPNK